jgi:hypothetical protein
MDNVIWLAGTELFAAPYDDFYVAKARQYVSDMQMTSDDVRIVKRGDQVLVVAKQDVRHGSDSPEQSQAGNR